MPVSPGLLQFRQLYELAPIILTGGITGSSPGSAASILSYTQSSAFASFLAPPTSYDTEQAFARFVPLPGATLIDNDVAHYPFANQATAANAIITKPLRISYAMIAPAQTPGSYFTRSAQFAALQATLTQHVLMGGLFACATPAFFWDSCLLLTMRDVTPADGTQRQVTWQLDFEQPLVTQQQAQQQYNVMLTKIGLGTQQTPSASGALATSGPQAAVGNSYSGQAQSVSPTAVSPGLSSYAPGQITTTPLGPLAGQSGAANFP